MVKVAQLPVSDLNIDLENFRTVRQRNEVAAVQAMIAISPRAFWALFESLLERGYIPSQNIILLQNEDGSYLVKEGNRRVACLKIAHGLLDHRKLKLPEQLIEKINALSKEWKSNNKKVPCTIYSDEAGADEVVSLTHGKGEAASRDEWEAVAKARHNREKNGASEPALDLLEKYLKKADNVTEEQKARWAGKYNLTVLDEAIKKSASRFGAASSPDLARSYPKVTYRKALDEVIHAIGMETLTFPMIRDSVDFVTRFGVPPLATASTSPGASAPGSGSTTSTPAGRPGADEGKGATDANAGSGSSGTTSGGTTKGAGTAGAGTKSAAASTEATSRTTATPINDERTVRKALRGLKLYGVNRAKLETVRAESLRLKLAKNPIAFCFLLRSMFEISAKVYCEENKGTAGAPKVVDSNGRDLPLNKVLQAIIKHLTQDEADPQMVRLLHGAGTELGKSEGLLSITSMNQLVHSPSFSLNVGDIPVVFANIYPLLAQMNK